MRELKYIRVYLHMYMSVERKYSHMVTTSSVGISVHYTTGTLRLMSAQEIYSPWVTFLCLKYM